jgi:hypothetical protein
MAYAMETAENDQYSKPVAKKHQDRLNELKEKVRQSELYFKDNNNRFKEFVKFVFNTSLTAEDITKLISLNKPTLEFNILEAIINNQLGQFFMHEPGILVNAADGVKPEDMTPQFLDQIDFVESYIRQLINGASNDGLQYNIYTDTTGGGFSVVKVYTDYINEFSFDQKIIVEKRPDPTACGFDPLAKESHKGDGGYCYEKHPYTKEEIERTFGKSVTKDMTFTRGEDFNWSYGTNTEKISIICDFYEKKYKKTKLVKISSGHTVTEKHYKELVDEWNKRLLIEQPPVIIQERWSYLETICRYQFCETKVLSYQETDYKYLPFIFIDGNSKITSDSSSGAVKQMTRPLVYHAKGIQRAKNFAGQTLLSEIENMVQHKFKVCIEGIPEDYQDAYNNVQQASVLLYNNFYKGNVDVRLPSPMEIQRTPTPPIVENIFIGADKVSQAILGTYDGVLGTNQQDVSGEALENAALHTSASTKPYLVNYIKGMQRAGLMVADLIPKYMVTPRTIPVIRKDGKKDFQIINNPNHPKNIDISYKPHELQLTITAGVNSTLQKQVALNTIIKMASQVPVLAKFFNDEGLEVLMDNIDIRGIERLKARIPEFLERIKKEQEASAQRVDPEVQIGMGMVKVEAEKVLQRKQESESKTAIEAAKIAVEKQKVDAQVMAILNEIDIKKSKILLEQERVDSENARTAIETAIELSTNNHEEV